MKIIIPDFVIENINNFYEEDRIEKEKARKLAERKAERDARRLQVGSLKSVKGGVK